MSANGFVHAFAVQHRTRTDRPFCWILGAGASVSSKIPTANELSETFLRALCREETGTDANYEAWLAGGGANIKGLDPKCPSRHYPQIYEACFGDCADAGYAYLEDVMRDKTPSYGYAVLAWLLAETQHRIVITTNFDNLVADALATHTSTFPRIVGHTQLTEFVLPELRRPLIAKIHGDLGFKPRNTPEEIASLDEEWQAALQKIFQRCTPIVIGYGGNDQSLMALLQNLEDGVPDRIYWCQLEGSRPSDEVQAFLAKRKGARLVRIPGFDELMILLEGQFQTGSAPMPKLDSVLELRQAKRLADFRAQRNKLGEKLAKAAPESPQAAPPTEAEKSDQQALAKAASQVLSTDKIDKVKSWWQWELEAQAQSTVEKRDEVYRQAVLALPDAAELLGNYALFLRSARRDLDRAETFYKRAIAADPKDGDYLGNYANFLRVERRDLDQAEALYNRALRVDPKHANNLGNYANFLRDERRDLDQAESLYKRALEAEPKHATHLGNYASFLRHERRDLDQAEALYKRALEAEPKHATHLGNYASFLRDERRDLDQAEALYKLALMADPNHATHLGNYANFMRGERRDLDQAEALYKRALEADPKHANNLGNYANFLRDERRDLDQAEALYKRALEADPKHANHVGNYALFMGDERRNNDQAEALFKRAIEADPKHANNLGNYAVLLRSERRDLDQAESFYKRALEADPKHANHLGNYANFLRHERRDLDQAETIYKRALDANSKHAANLGNYANFLRHERHDPDQAEVFYKRALEADPRNATAFSTYATFLRDERSKFDQAEVYYRRALEIDPKDANTTGNLAQTLFILGRAEEALASLEKAELLANAGEASKALASELAFYRVAHDPRSFGASLKGLRKLLEQGARSPKWPLQGNISRAEKDEHPNVPLLRALAAVISNGADTKTLEVFPEWQAAKG
jgi:Tfp pilus assembly protein PilF